MTEVHAKYAPSGMHRTLNCSGSIQICEPLPELPTSDYALEGSVAHLVASRCLERDLDALAYVDSTIVYEERDWKITAEMVVAVQVYLNEVRRKQRLMPNAQFLIEEQLRMDWIDPQLFGTGDHVAIEPLVKVCVDDYKHGAGIAVDVEDNPQLMTYGIGAIGDGNPNMVEVVEMTITQPRAPHADGSIRQWEMKADTLIEWGFDVLVPGIARTKSKDHLSFVAGDWCRWCAALHAVGADGSAVCPAIKNQRKTMIQNMFGTSEGTIPDNPKPIMDMSAVKLDWVLNNADNFIAGIAAFKAEAVRRLEMNAPNRPTQYKLVTGKSSRYWENPEAVASFVKNETLEEVDPFTDPMLKSPAQMELALTVEGYDKLLLKDHIGKTPGKPKMLHISKAGKALTPRIEAMFGETLDPFDEIDPFS